MFNSIASLLKEAVKYVKLNMNGVDVMKEVKVYTDGACSGNPGAGGWGTILEYKGVKKELDKELDNLNLLYIFDLLNF